MSKTRYASPGAPLSQERYLSSPEYAELRGISGNAVTTKAALMATPEKRSLLFFLQAMSLKPGGLKEFCRLFLEMFAGRVGTPTMHRVGMKPGQVYDEETTDEIHRELRALTQRPRKNAEQYVDWCHEKLAALEPFIIDLCINPKLRFVAPGETEQEAACETIAIKEQFAHEGLSTDSPTHNPPYFKCFRDIIGALFEYQRRYEHAARTEFVLTEVGRKVFEVLDVGLATGKLVVIEGDSRIGKTTVAEAWCNLNLGQARFISLSGITHKTGLFRALAKALGLGSGYAKSSTEMQTRIEDLLQRSRLMVVVDEAHHLFSSSERVYSRPELVDWINTALYNHRVPIGLICTPQFALRMARAEKQTTWNADQLRGRIKRFCTLPSRPPDKDIEAVAVKLLPCACRDTLKLLTGYAKTSPRLPFPALVNAIDEARLLAGREGRAEITFEDVDRAIADYCVGSSEAMARSFDCELASKRPSRQPATAAQTPRAAAAASPQPSRQASAPEPALPPALAARATNLAAVQPLETNRLKNELDPA